ncbi:protein YgfX [Methyloversatilis sp. RAC08]|uniref:protein YgfX n=1 Tax=Methyloversatilis sp. RAC08 TaxID=1842540 RepID=UPI003FA5E9AE
MRSASAGPTLRWCSASCRAVVVGNDGPAAFARIELQGSRCCNAALFVCAASLIVSVLLRPAVAPVAAAALALALLARRRAAWKVIQLSEAGQISLCRADGLIATGRPVTGRVGRWWVSLSLRPDQGTGRTLMLFGDQFAAADDFRRLRRWLRAALPDDAHDADAGWSGWRSRWFPGNRD